MSNNVKENYILLEIEGKHLESAYSVYIIEVNNKENSKESKYYYIGQTGDSQYITARSPLRRLMGHLTDIKSSTQNQVFKYFAKELLKNRKNANEPYSGEEKQKIESFFVKSKIKMYSFPLKKFSYNANKQDHREKRKQVIEFEKQVIKLFKESGKILMNKNIPSNVNETIQFVEEYNEIKRLFNL